MQRNVRRHFVQGLGLVCVLSACASPVELRNKFDPMTAQYVLDRGSNTITGQAYLILPPFFHKRTCADSSEAGAYLIPVTPYSKERMDFAYRYSRDDYTGRWNLQMLPDNPEYMKYTRHADCDSQGRFRFESVANGHYYVLAMITYLSSGHAFSGGGLLREVSVSGGQTQDVLLEKNLAQQPHKLGGK